MRILVTGSAGQVAQSLSERVDDKDEWIFSRRAQLDLSNIASLERAVRDVHPDLIISAAAYTAVDKAEDEPELARRINAEAPAALGTLAREIGCRIIHLSTDYVFDGALDRPYVETDAVGPRSVYGETKLAGEEGVKGSGADFAIVRTAWVYSPFGQNFLKTMLRLAADRDEVRVVNDQQGCPTSALDIADGLIALAQCWRTDPEAGLRQIFHLCGSGSTSWAGFAEAIFAESLNHGGPAAKVIGIPSREYPTRAVRPFNSRMDCAHFARTFGYRAPEWERSTAQIVSRILVEPSLAV